MLFQSALYIFQSHQRQLQALVDPLQLLHHLLKEQDALCKWKRWIQQWDEPGKMHPNVKKSWEWELLCSHLAGDEHPEFFPAPDGGWVGQPGVLLGDLQLHVCSHSLWGGKRGWISPKLIQLGHGNAAGSQPWLLPIWWVTSCTSWTMGGSSSADLIQVSQNSS